MFTCEWVWSVRNVGGVGVNLWIDFALDPSVSLQPCSVIVLSQHIQQNVLYNLNSNESNAQNFRQSELFIVPREELAREKIENKLVK